jgi:hypothetical protein
VAFDASGDLTPTPAQAALIRSLSGFRKPPEAWAPKPSIDASQDEAEDEAEEKLRRDCQGKGYTLLLADDDPFSRELGTSRELNEASDCRSCFFFSRDHDGTV